MNCIKGEREPNGSFYETCGNKHNLNKANGIALFEATRTQMHICANKSTLEMAIIAWTKYKVKKNIFF